MNRLRKVFSLGDMKYGWLLAVSMIICGVLFYADRTYDPDDQFWLSVGYGVSFGLAVLWSGLNYIGHIRVNALYRKMSDIRAYVEQLAMSGEDKQELVNYLEDYANDLKNQGRSAEEATAEAISQFQVKELLSLSKHTSLFNLHAHYYLFGWAAAALLLWIAIVVIDGLFFANALPALVAETILAVYGAALTLLFFVYKLLDAMIHQKLHKHET